MKEIGISYVINMDCLLYFTMSHRAPIQKRKG